jgi:sigma-B regulation protein RsbU (phosphoserine phosphatase)
MSHAEFRSVLEAGHSTVSHSPPHNSLGPQARIHELESRLAEVRKDYAELHTALFDGAQVHRRLCAPRLLRYGEFEIASEVFAVRYLAGDFFTVEEVDGDVVLALGDITGKGIAAGMWTTLLVGLVAMQRRVNTDPEAIVSSVNKDLCALSPSVPLLSLFLARLNPASGALEYCNAGHPPALLLQADGQLESLSIGGPLLGAVRGASFATGRIDLSPGDILLAYSDGIIEARNGGDEDFGRERLEAQLCRASVGDADHVLFSVLGAVRDFAAQELADDTSVVVIRRNLSGMGDNGRSAGSHSSERR